MSLETFFQTGLAIDLILIVVVLEVVVLAVWPRLRGSMTLLDVVSLVAPGVMLMLALRSALTDAPNTMTAVFLTAAFACHLWDVARRRRARR
jgi:hypothetical protein